ncbi:MAG: T9SS type A sorting domain-containing protein [Chloroflexota bacterium]
MPFPLGDYAWKIAVAPDSVSFAAGSSDGYLRLFKSNAIFGPDETVDIPGTTSRDSQMLFPNPASDFINLPGLADAVDEVSLYSAIGCKVYSGKPDGGRLNVSFLPPGIYFLEQGRKYYKFIKV